MQCIVNAATACTRSFVTVALVDWLGVRAVGGDGTINIVLKIRCYFRLYASALKLLL